MNPLSSTNGTMELPIEVFSKYVAQSLVDIEDTKGLIALAKAYPRIIDDLFRFHYIKRVNLEDMEYGHIWFYIDITDPLFIERTIRKLKRTFEIDGKKNRINRRLVFGILMFEIISRDVEVFWEGINKLKSERYIERYDGKIGKSDVTVKTLRENSHAVLVLNFSSKPMAIHSNKRQPHDSSKPSEFITFDFFGHL